MSMSKNQIEYYNNKSFNDFVEASFERYTICPYCDSDQGYYNDYFDQYACRKCGVMDFDKKYTWVCTRRTIIGSS